MSAEADQLWLAVTNMAGGNPTSALTPMQWCTLQAHMMKWRTAHGHPPHYYGAAEDEFHVRHRTELHRAWMELYLGRTP